MILVGFIKWLTDKVNSWQLNIMEKALHEKEVKTATEEAYREEMQKQAVKIGKAKAQADAKEKIAGFKSKAQGQNKATGGNMLDYLVGSQEKKKSGSERLDLAKEIL